MALELSIEGQLSIGDKSMEKRPWEEEDKLDAVCIDGGKEFHDEHENLWNVYFAFRDLWIGVIPVELNVALARGIIQRRWYQFSARYNLV